MQHEDYKLYCAGLFSRFLAMSCIMIFFSEVNYDGYFGTVIAEGAMHFCALMYQRGQESY
jgi:hypothetical protein